MRDSSFAVAIQTTLEASTGTSTNSSTNSDAVSRSNSEYSAPRGSYCASPPTLSISATTITGLA
jgi:hypothetical protein